MLFCILKVHLWLTLFISHRKEKHYNGKTKTIPERLEVDGEIGITVIPRSALTFWRWYWFQSLAFDRRVTNRDITNYKACCSRRIEIQNKKDKLLKKKRKEKKRRTRHPTGNPQLKYENVNYSSSATSWKFLSWAQNRSQIPSQSWRL